MKRKKYIFILIILCFVVLLIGCSRFFMVSFMGLTEEQAGTIAGIGQVIVELVAAIMIVFQLEQEQDTEKRQNDIEEAKFILQYNQAFIQDPNMSEVEHRLELYKNGKLEEPLINDENRQKFINYLVYLEGLAPLILRGVLHLNSIDDLMAYRFFLAVNNREVQNDQLIPDWLYYRGCFKLYKIWKEYRLKQGIEILNATDSLDKTVVFEYALGRKIEIKTLEKEEDFEQAGKILFETDPYIYPAAFGNQKKAGGCFKKLFAKNEFIFSADRIKLLVENGDIKAVAVVVKERPKVIFEVKELMKSIPELPNSFIHTYENYFKNIPDYLEQCDIYIPCICVKAGERGKGYGEILLKNLIHMEDFNERVMMLHVLTENSSAIHLYEKYGFQKDGGEQEGYAVSGQPPKCYAMKRNPVITGNCF